MATDYSTLIKSAGMLGVEPTTVITGLKYTAGMVKAFNNVTFLYDPHWTYESGYPTHPIAFFYVKSMNEIMTTEISQKPVLFYNTSNSQSGSAGGLTDIISDNILIKPKTYRLDIIIPANNHTFKTSGYGSFENIADTLSIGTNSYQSNNTGTVTQNAFSTFSGLIGRMGDYAYSVAESVVTALFGQNAQYSSILNAMTSQQDYNKNSIEYMWRNRRILKLKVWNGWQFKYLAIQNFEVSKKGEDGDYYEGSLTMQEIPILTFRQEYRASTLTKLEGLSSKLGETEKIVVDKFITAMSSTYESPEVKASRKRLKSLHSVLSGTTE